MWDPCVITSFPRPNHTGLAVLLGLLECLVAPRAGDDVIHGVVRGAEVERHGGELGGGAALEEQDGITRRDFQEGVEISLGFFDDGHEILATVAHLHDAHAGSLPEVELGLGAAKYVLGQGGVTGGEVEDALLGLGLELGRRGSAFDGPESARRGEGKSGGGSVDRVVGEKVVMVGVKKV